jgi:hypothetical protein
MLFAAATAWLPRRATPATTTATTTATASAVPATLALAVLPKTAVLTAAMLALLALPVAATTTTAATAATMVLRTWLAPITAFALIRCSLVLGRRRRSGSAAFAARVVSARRGGLARLKFAAVVAHVAVVAIITFVAVVALVARRFRPLCRRRGRRRPFLDGLTDPVRFPDRGRLHRRRALIARSGGKRFPGGRHRLGDGQKLGLYSLGDGTAPGPAFGRLGGGFFLRRFGCSPSARARSARFLFTLAGIGAG